MGPDTLKEARRLWLSSVISAVNHSTSNVFLFRGSEAFDSDDMTLYAADLRPETSLPGWQDYVLKESKGSIMILLSENILSKSEREKAQLKPRYLKDLLLNIIEIMAEEVEIKDEVRVVKRLPRGYVNLAVSDKFRLIDFQNPKELTELFKKLLEVDLVLAARYEFNASLLEAGIPGSKELLDIFASAITYLPQLLPQLLSELDDKDRIGTEARFNKLLKERPEIFGKDPDKPDKKIIKGVRSNIPNKVIYKDVPGYTADTLKEKGVWGLVAVRRNNNNTL